MATTNRKQTALMIEKLRQNPAAFDFFQAVRLLLQEKKQINFKTSPSFIFPKGDITDIKPADKDQKAFDMTVTFMSLIGSHGLLPPHYTERLLKQLQQKESGLRDFLNLLQQRSIAMFYEAWEKHHFYVGYERALKQQTNDNFSKTLYSMAGFGTKTMQKKLPIAQENMAFYGGFFANAVRTASNLKAIITSFFQVQTVIKELQGEWLYLDAANCTTLAKPHYLTNSNNRLGIDTSAGTKVWHSGHKFRVQLGPLSQNQLSKLLPNGIWFPILQNLIRLYIGMEFNFEIQLILAAKYIKMPQLKKHLSPKLGWNSWLCSKPATKDRNDVILNTGENNNVIN